MDFWIAATNGDILALRRLVFTQKNGFKTTYEALLGVGHPQAWEMAVEYYKAVNELENGGANKISPLLLAASNGHTEAVKILIDEVHLDPNWMETGYSALHLASVNGHASTAVLLLDRGAHVNAVYRGKLQEHCTALHMAVRRAHANVVLVLLSAGADTTIPDEKGRTPLDLAVEMIFKDEGERVMGGYEKVVDLLRLVRQHREGRGSSSPFTPFGKPAAPVKKVNRRKPLTPCKTVCRELAM